MRLGDLRYDVSSRHRRRAGTDALKNRLGHFPTTRNWLALISVQRSDSPLVVCVYRNAGDKWDVGIPRGDIVRCKTKHFASTKVLISNAVPEHVLRAHVHAPQ